MTPRPRERAAGADAAEALAQGPAGADQSLQGGRTGTGRGFETFLYDACVNLLNVTKGVCYVCMSSSELHALQRAFIAAGGKWSTFVIWAKNTFTLGRADYQRQYEPILYGWKAATTPGAAPA